MPRQTAAQRAAAEAETTRAIEGPAQPSGAGTRVTGSAGAWIERETDLSWWCPICDHSQTKLVTTCGGCGARRDGDTVTP